VEEGTFLKEWNNSAEGAGQKNLEEKKIQQHQLVQAVGISAAQIRAA